MRWQEMTWHHAADIADLAEKDVIGRDCAGHRIALYRVAGRYYATSDVCTHQNALLSEGEVVEGCIECPLHFGLFAIATGEAQGAPVCVDLRVYPVRVVGTRLEVAIDET
ncbi:non-heme iron oxygenase ferredoxin subunit [Methylobacterium sp. JK268]